MGVVLAYSNRNPSDCILKPFLILCSVSIIDF
jgi:hypothetical protein